MKRTLALLFTALTLFTLSGCANWDEGTYSNDPLGELAKYYQVDTEEETPDLTVFALPYLGGETLDPITCAGGVQLTLSTLLYEPLYRLTPQFEVENVLAQSESYDAESFTYTIRLRSGVQFSDGSPLTAQDVAYTLLRAQQSSRYAARLADVTAVKAQDSNTLTIQLAQDRRTFTALLDIPIVRSGTETQLFPVGTGPYVKDADNDALRRNSHWWRTESLPFDTISLLSYKSGEAAAYAFSSHDVHLLAYDMTGTGVDVASTSGSYTDADTTILQFLGFNMARGLFQDAAMRQAISSLKVQPDLLLNDAVTIPLIPIRQVGIIKGDARSLSIAAASIMAKGTRDRMMVEYAELYPEYGFEKNKGYGSAEHREALKKYGPCPIHRSTFIHNWIS